MMISPEGFAEDNKGKSYDTEYTCLLESGSKLDPLPFLLSYGENASCDKYAGIWLGDIISVSNKQPCYAYKDITDSHIWDYDMN